MNRKNLLWSVFAIMMATTLSVGFASCSDDDDDVNSSIIGTWEETNYFDGTWQWTFNSNGKGSRKVTDNTTYTFSFSFSFDGTTLKISGVRDGESYTDVYSVSFSDNGKTMTWIEEYNGLPYTTTLKKI